MVQEQVGVLTLPELQQQIVNWLLGRSPQPVDKIADQLGIGILQLEDALSSLMEADIIWERVIAGKICYGVQGSDSLSENFLEEIETPRQALTLGKPLSVIINPLGEIVALPGTIVEVCVTVTNQGDRSAVFDVYMDEGSGQVYQWCSAAQERLALSCGQSSEVIFAIAIPLSALPNSYEFMLVVDAPQHYPEDTPIQHHGLLTVTVPIQEVVKVNDPTFGIVPITSPEKPQQLQPGEPMQITVTVLNRSDRVDRFRVSLPDLESNWFTVYYPEGLAQAGIIVASDGLQLNPGESGKISVVIKPPVDTWAGVYTPALKLRSDNFPDLALLDVVYIEVQAVHMMQIEFVTIANRVQKDPALYDLRIQNQSNVIRELTFSAMVTEEQGMCTFRFVPEEIQLLPKATGRVTLEAEPTRKFRPRFFVDRFLSFNVEITDKRQLPLFANRFVGNLMIPARPWWQLLLVVLAVMGFLGTLVFLVWYFFFRQPSPPTVLEFSSEANVYLAVEGQAIRLRWRISDPNNIQTLTIVGKSPENKVISRSVTYDFSQGIPLELREFCAIDEILICQNVPTDARQAGTYIFEMAVVPRGNRGIALVPVRTSNILIAPVPIPQVIELLPAQPSFMEAKVADPVVGTIAETVPPPPMAPASPPPEPQTEQPTTPTKPPGVLLNWRISHFRQIREIVITGRTPEGETIMQPIRYDLNLGMPEPLQELCRVEADILTCQNVPTQISQAGNFQFTVTAIPRQPDPQTPAPSRTTDVIKVKPLPINLVEFRVNGEPVLPRYIFNVSATVPTLLTIDWEIEGSAQMQIELLPAPGTIARQGQTAIALPPKASETTYTLQITNPDGARITRSFVVQTIPIPPPPPAEAGRPPAVPPLPAIDSPLVPPPTPELAPSEVPPRRN